MRRIANPLPWTACLMLEWRKWSCLTTSSTSRVRASSIRAVTGAPISGRLPNPWSTVCRGRIVGVGKTIRIQSMHVHYDLTVPCDAVEATERALAVHVQGCPAHQSVKEAIHVTWAATLRAGDRTLTVWEENQAASDFGVLHVRATARHRRPAGVSLTRRRAREVLAIRAGS
jgi:hypothetical protein